MEGIVLALRRFWGWGYEGEGPSQGARERLASNLSEVFGVSLRLREPPRIQDIQLRPSRIVPHKHFAHLVSDDTYERASHSYGKSYRDIVRGFHADFSNPPDLVAFPEKEDDIVGLLDWCGDHEVAAVPYGGGSSVVGGVEPNVGDGYSGVVTIDMSRFDKLVDIDAVSGAALIQAGIYGPALEDKLRESGLTLRHFPQSFECSTLGGWIATRSGGHFATLYTHIDELVEALRMVTPRGIVETRRLPGSGAGPSPDRLVIGSEGVLGIITEAWMRLHRRPVHRASGAVRFTSFEDGVHATRAVAQAGLHPSNCRLLDPAEALASGTDDGSAAILLLGFESADHPVDAWMSRAVELCRDFGGVMPWPAADAAGRPSGVETWRRSFMQAPYVRDALVSMGVICETFETAITWDRFEHLHDAVLRAVNEALNDVGAASGWVTCRFTHVYPDGPAPYFSVLAPARVGAELEQWSVIKEAASRAVVDAGGTITHHHAIGRDHMPWYRRERPELFGDALVAAKREMDPSFTLNPGVLIDRRSLSQPG